MPHSLFYNVPFDWRQPSKQQNVTQEIRRAVREAIEMRFNILYDEKECGDYVIVEVTAERKADLVAFRLSIT